MTVTDPSPDTAEAGVAVDGASTGYDVDSDGFLTQLDRLPRSGAVLRMSEVEAAELADQPIEGETDQTMLVNMGPSHPSTHGVLRLMLELDGETVRRSKRPS